MPAPSGNGFQDLRRGSFGRIVAQAATVHIPDAVHNGDLVPDTMPEHPHAMRALVRVQKSESAIYFVSIENLHTAKIQH